ncbi:MAG: hypothetical protein ACKVYV_09425 [Limisphaerales bacterium]
MDPDFDGGQRPVAPPAPTRSAASFAAAPADLTPARVPSRGEIETQVTAAQQQLAELRRQQEALELERGRLEEDRRRRLELEQGRGEMTAHLTRGVALLEEEEFAARRDAEQMSRTLTDLRAALAKVHAIQEQGWTAESYQTELSRALTALESARMEWNSARLKWPVLTGSGAGVAAGADVAAVPEESAAPLLRPKTFGDLCRLGFALTWPVAAACLLVGVVVVVALARR